MDSTGRPNRSAGSGFASKYLILFLINILVALVWAALLPIFGALDYVVGYLAGLAFLTLVESSYSRQTLRVFSFIAYSLWEILLSSVILAWTVIQPSARLKARLRPSIIGVPLTVTGDLEIAVLATVITLTPGTLSLDLSPDHSILYVHGLNIEDPQAFQMQIKEGFERRLLQISRGIA